jgi:Protein of unknown function (DUF4240)
MDGLAGAAAESRHSSQIAQNVLSWLGVRASRWRGRAGDVGPRWHDPAMDITAFWDLIEAGRASAGPGKPFHQALTDLLAGRTREEILQYQDRFDEMHRAVYRWDMRAAAYLIGDGSADDSFMDFRAGLIAQGRDWYHTAAASPESLAGHPAVAAAAGRPWDNPLFYEEAAYAASYAFEQVTGNEHAFWDALDSRTGRDRGPADMGEHFDFKDDQVMRTRLPRLFALCLGDNPS